MILDSGIIQIYNLQNIAPKGSMPVEKLQFVSEHYFGERTVGYNRFYEAKGANQQADLLVRVWQDRTLSTKQYAVIDNRQYRIIQVQHLLDERNLKVTDLTLERLDDLYDVITE